jgi:hypothetical protein
MSLWVCGNILWAYGELFDADYDQPTSFFSRYIILYKHDNAIICILILIKLFNIQFIFVCSSPIKWLTFRWYSSCTLVLAFVPLIILHILWIYYTVEYNSANRTSNKYKKSSYANRNNFGNADNNKHQYIQLI